MDAPAHAPTHRRPHARHSTHCLRLGDARFMQQHYARLRAKWPIGTGAVGTRTLHSGENVARIRLLTAGQECKSCLEFGLLTLALVSAGAHALEH
eukprot:6174329-Pleurochrysis_carterae.AAC.2